MNTERKIKKELDEIRELLDVLESHMAWLIKPESRFKIGQRVEFGRKAKRVGIVQKKRLTQRATIVAIDGFSIAVKLDDSPKRVRTFHHAFFNPVSGPKWF